MKHMLLAAMSCAVLAFAQEDQDVAVEQDVVVVEQEVAVDTNSDATSSDTDN